MKNSKIVATHRGVDIVATHQPAYLKVKATDVQLAAQPATGYNIQVVLACVGTKVKVRLVDGNEPQAQYVDFDHALRDGRRLLVREIDRYLDDQARERQEREAEHKARRAFNAAVQSFFDTEPEAKPEPSDREPIGFLL